MNFRYYYFIGYTLLTFLFAQAAAQKTNTFIYIKETFTDDIKHVFYLGTNIIQRPLKFDQNDYLKIGLTSVLTSALFIADPNIK